MKPKVKILSLLFILMFFVQNLIGQEESPFVPGEVIIQMKRGINPSVLLKEMGVTTSRSASQSIEQIASAPFSVYHLKLHFENDELDKAMDLLRKDERVLLVQKNKIIKYRSAPNDPLYKDQWQFKNPAGNGIDFNIEKAWDITTGGVTAFGDTIVVAVLEDGIGKHEDIVKNLWINHQEVPGDNIDNDGNGYIDDYYGWNISTRNDNVNLDDRHGTSVAGIIGATGNNSLGVSGINWNVKIMSVVTGDITEANVISAYSYVYVQRKLYNDSKGKKGAFVVATNSSWGIDRGKPSDSPIWCAFYDSLGSVGILSCAATANESINVDVEGDLPTACSSNYLISVTNLNKNDVRVQSSGYGKNNIDIGAFGDGTYNITSSNRYSTFTGTSASTPHVSGAIALAYSVPCTKLMDLVKQNPASAALYLKQALLSTAKSNASLEGITRSQGRLDIGDFIENVNSWCNACAPPLIDDSYNVKDEGTLKVMIAEKALNIKVDLRIRPEGSQNWLLYDNVNSDFLIEGLKLCTDYEYQLRTSCDNQILTDFQYSRYITSFGCCPIPVINNFSKGNNTIFINLSDQDLVDESILEIREKDFEVWKKFPFNLMYTLGDLNNCTIYEYRFTNSCLDGRSYSPITNEKLFYTDCGSCTSEEYCDQITIDNKQEWISSVSLASTIWESGKDLQGFGQFLGYKMPKIQRNQKYPLEIIPAFLNQTYQEYFKVFIDFDQNKEFSENEMVYKSPTRLPFVRDSIFIPANVLPGITRMRVIMSFDDEVIKCNVAGNYGEVEEYCIDFQPTVAVINQEFTADQIDIINTVFYNDEISGRSSLRKAEKIDLFLFSVDGKLVNSQILNLPSDIHQWNFKGPENLSPGIYILKLRGREAQKSFKIIKQ